MKTQTKKKEPRIFIYCKHCGSDKVTRDASAAWSIPEQKWELCATFDAAYCETCGGQSTLGEAQLNEKATP